MNPDTQELIRRLKALYVEFKAEEKTFHKQGDDDSECTVYACAERLKEEVEKFIKENA